jgi:SAM-dependent methyltransferase
LQRFASLIKTAGLVIDVGCGPGFDTVELGKLNLHAIGLDYSQSQIRAGRRHHQVEGDFVQADMRALPFAKCVDGVWLCASFLHIPRRAALGTLRELARVIAPGGIMFLSVKRGDEEKWSKTSHGHPVPRYYVYWQPEALDPLLAAAGFDVFDGWVDFAGSTAWLVRLARKNGESSID